jgi:acyl-CoA thioester hydrolase
MPNYSLTLRVYYEDTDAGGVVYYANYLKFYERCRTEYLRELGFEQDQLINEYGIVFVVRHVDVDYLRPALFNDELIVDLKVVKMAKVSIVFEQTVVAKRDLETIINKAKIIVVCVDKTVFRATAIPDAIKNQFIGTNLEH